MPFHESPNCFPPTLNRDTGAKIFDIIAAARLDDYIPIYSQVEFAHDALFCEYCYCVDLDAEVFEIFGGHTDIPNDKDDGKVEQIGKNRFLEVCKAAKPMPFLEEAMLSMPSMLKSWPLAQLPKDLDDMLTQVAADNAGVFEGNEEGDGEDDEDGGAEDAVNDDTGKKVVDDKKTGDEDKAVNDGGDKKSQEDSDKKPGDEDKKAVVPDEDKKTVDDDKKKTEHDNGDLIDKEYEKNIEKIAEDLLIEAAQQEIRMERERAMMQETGTAQNKDRTFTLSIRETK